MSVSTPLAGPGNVRLAGVIAPRGLSFLLPDQTACKKQCQLTRRWQLAHRTACIVRWCWHATTRHRPRKRSSPHEPDVKCFRIGPSRHGLDMEKWADDWNGATWIVHCLTHRIPAAKAGINPPEIPITGVAVESGTGRASAVDVGCDGSTTGCAGHLQKGLACTAHMLCCHCRHMPG